MCKCKKTPQKTASLDTLGTRSDKTVFSSPDNDDFVLDKKTSIKDLKPIKKREIRKALQVPLALEFVRLSEHAQDLMKLIEYEMKHTGEIPNTIEASELLLLEEPEVLQKENRAFWNMFSCASILKQQGESITGKYCKNRFCIVCNSIRQAQLLNRYKPVFAEWDCYFVTLTVPNVKAYDLGNTVNRMNKTFGTIKDTVTKYLRRLAKGEAKKSPNKPESFKGVKKVECTYNARTDEYHPHFHFMVDSKETADYIVSEWLKRTRDLNTSASAQDVQKAYAGKELELFKYFTKVVSKPKQKGGKREIISLAQYVIYRAFKNKQTFGHFGINLSVRDLEKEEKEKRKKEAEAKKDQAVLAGDKVKVYRYDKEDKRYLDSSGEPLVKGARSPLKEVPINSPKFLKKNIVNNQDIIAKDETTRKGIESGEIKRNGKRDRRHHADSFNPFEA